MVVYLTILGIVSVSGRGWDVVISRKNIQVASGWLGETPARGDHAFGFLKILPLLTQATQEFYVTLYCNLV